LDLLQAAQLLVIRTWLPKTAPMTGGVKDNLSMMTKALQDQGITDPKMIQATLANVMKETGGKINVEEDLAGYANTSNERIRSIFGARAAKKSDEELNQIKKDPKQFAEMMYGKDSGMGLGNVDPGDAYKYRGRGAVGLTGKANYAQASKDLFGDDRLVQNPEIIKRSRNGSQDICLVHEEKHRCHGQTYGHGRRSTNTRTS
jgi:predicted chitinase